MELLALIEPLDPVSGARTTVRICSANDRRLCGLGGQQWWPAMSQRPTIKISLFDGDFSSDANVAVAQFTIQTGVIEVPDALVRRYVWAGAKVTLYKSSEPYSTSTEMMRGVVTRFALDSDRITLSMDVDRSPLEANVLRLEYAGTGGKEGDANLKGRVKPWLFGRARNVEPVLINAVDNVYQVSAYGPIKAITGVFERGAQFASNVGNFADYAALVAASIPEGKWGYCLAEGMIRLGAPAYGVITADVEGDDPAASPWLQKTGEILSRIAAEISIPGTSINSTSLTAFDAAVTYPVNLYLTDQISFLELARLMARPCNAQAGIDLLGRLYLSRITIGSPSLTLDGQGRQWPPVQSITEESVSPPYKRVMLGADRSWRVHSFDEIATSSPLADRGDYDAATVYREGNIVTTPNGSKWLFISATPQSGVVPGTNGAVWQNMSGAVEADWSLVSGAGKPADNATVGATWGGDITNQPADYALFNAYRADAMFSDDFDLAGAASSWEPFFGAPPGTRTASSDASGGFTLRIGDNSGDDTAFLIHKNLIPFDPNKLYEFRFRVRQVAGTGATYLGFAGVAADGVTGVNEIGEPNYSSAHYIAASGVSVPSTWTTYIGYVKGTAANGTNSARPDPANPGVAHNAVRYLRPLLLGNYNGQTGILEVDYVQVREYDPRVASTINADGTIKDSKVVASSFATGIEPVSVVTSVPGSKATNAIYNSTDGKLYRWNGAAYTAAVPSTDISGQISDAQISALAAAKLTGQITSTQITDDAVTTPKVAAGAITTAELAAGSVVTSKLAIIPSGNAINDDPGTQDITAWYGSNIATVADSTSPTGYALHCSANETVYSSRMVPLDKTKNYLARIKHKQATGSSTSYLLIAFYDAAGNLLSNGAPGNTGWASISTYNYFGLVDAVGTAGWTEYSIPFGPDETAKIPTDTAFIRIGLLSNYTGSGSVRVTDLRIIEKASASLIVDGSITAAKVGANAITADKIAAGAVTAAKISVSSLDAISANLGTITVGSANITDLAVTSIKIAGDAVSTAKIAYNAASTISLVQPADVFIPIGTAYYKIAELLNYSVDGTGRVMIDLGTAIQGSGTVDYSVELKRRLVGAPAASFVSTGVTLTGSGSSTTNIGIPGQHQSKFPIGHNIKIGTAEGGEITSNFEFQAGGVWTTYVVWTTPISWPASSLTYTQSDNYAQIQNWASVLRNAAGANTFHVGQHLRFVDAPAAGSYDYKIGVTAYANTASGYLRNITMALQQVKKVN